MYLDCDVYKTADFTLIYSKCQLYLSRFEMWYLVPSKPVLFEVLDRHLNSIYKCK